VSARPLLWVSSVALRDVRLCSAFARARCTGTLDFSMGPAATELYALSLHDALPIFELSTDQGNAFSEAILTTDTRPKRIALELRSEEHTSELQSHLKLVCRFLLEKKN